MFGGRRRRLCLFKMGLWLALSEKKGTQYGRFGGLDWCGLDCSGLDCCGLVDGCSTVLASCGLQSTQLSRRVVWIGNRLCRVAVTWFYTRTMGSSFQPIQATKGFLSVSRTKKTLACAQCPPQRPETPSCERFLPRVLLTQRRLDTPTSTYHRSELRHVFLLERTPMNPCPPV